MANVIGNRSESVDNAKLAIKRRVHLFIFLSIHPLGTHWNILVAVIGYT